MEYVSGHLAINKWAEEDRPREKLVRKGKSALSEAELIGILLGSGSRTISAVDLAKIILAHVGNDLNALAKLTVTDLMKFKGIGEAKAISIVSALELGRRRKASEPHRKPIIRSSNDAFECIKPDLIDQPHEEFWLILLKRNNEVIGKEKISLGGVSGTVADPKIIFKRAIDALASSIILVHNHPSGNIRPSETDIHLTRKIQKAGEVLEITIFDHIIFTDHDYFSFADEGMMTF